MSCCGQKRAGYYQANGEKPADGAGVHPSQKMWPDPAFEYTGETALTITGTITGKRYRFSFQGDVQVVDYRDAGPMRAIPVLRKLA